MTTYTENRKLFHEATGRIAIQVPLDEIIAKLKYFADMIAATKNRIYDFKCVVSNVDQAGYSDHDGFYGNQYHIGYSDHVKNVIRSALNNQIAAEYKLLKKQKLKASIVHQGFVRFIIEHPFMSETRESTKTKELRAFVHDLLRKNKAMVNFE